MPSGGMDWTHYLSAMVLVAVRLSGLMVFAPIFSSGGISTQVEGGLSAGHLGAGSAGGGGTAFGTRRIGSRDDCG